MSDNNSVIMNDRYEMQQRIGRGGMADVYLARDILLDRLVAIKVLFPEFATDPAFVERFRREAQSAGNLNHPNIVSVYDWGRSNNTYFMAMEYVPGRTLAEALADAAEDPEAVAKFSKSLRKESKRLSGLIKDIIQLSRIQSAEIVTNAEIVDLSTVVMEAVDRNSFRAENRGLKITYDAPEGVEVVGDPEMLTVAVKNLIENAIIYSDEGASVGVGLRSIDNVAEITVTDSGIGIANSDQGRIFERFYRVDPSRSRKTGGTGLGLAIVKHVALSHNGEVKLFSKPGVGSTFTLRIPRADKNIVVSESERNAS